MSRGMGDVQRRLLAIFDHAKNDLVDTFELTASVYELKPDATGFVSVSEAELSSVRRALILLAKQGWVCGLRGFHNGRQCWGLPHALVLMERRGLPIAECLRHGRKAFWAAKRNG